MLKVATHSDPMHYWDGGNYELNLSFDGLRDQMWLDVLRAIWSAPCMRGPLPSRYTPGETPPTSINIQVPPPTAIVKQHGIFTVNGQSVGCDVQATRSIFECVSILIPIGMFHGLSAQRNFRIAHPDLETLDQLFYEIVLRVNNVAPFQIAALGYERSCQLLSELRSEGEARHNFLVMGHFVARGDVLRELEPDLGGYEEVAPNLYWVRARI
ncbi:MAG: hypothetical protein OHK0023_26620 [Anaerolineae bacterium]